MAGSGRALACGAGLLAWVAALVPLVLLATMNPPANSPEDSLLPPLAPGSYPAAPRGEVTDVYHGVSVPDPWRWMEELDSPAVADWVARQNALTAGYIAGLPGRDRFATRLRQLLDFERVGVPQREAGVYAYTHNPGTAEQDALWVTDDPARPGRKLVDPLALRADGTVSLGSFRLSPDGRLLAYSLSDGGTDWKTWHLVRVADGGPEPEIIRGTKFTGVSWLRDGSGFVYSRYPSTEAGAGEGGPGEGWDDSRQVALYFHRLGTDPAGDPLVHAVTDHPRREPYGAITEDGRFLVIHLQDGYETNGLHYRRLGGGDSLLTAPVVPLLDGWDARYEFIGNVGDTFYVLTTKDAPRGRVVAIDLADPAPERWRTVVPEQAETLESVDLVGGRLLIQSVRDAHAVVQVADLSGGPLREIPLPGQGTVAGFTASAEDPESFFLYTDFTTPRTLYRLDVGEGVPAVVRKPRADFNPADFVSEQVFITSRDGTRVPLSIVRRRDVVPDGRRPTVLYGYGGFNVSLLPGYSATRMAWIEAGGIYVQANLRGGGEYGEEWHLAGTKLRKQNVFDDFIAAAGWLIAEGYTSPRNLAIWGGSNGGLLVGAVTNQRPELFAAAVPAVGVMDMLRYQEASLNARQWSSDYGLSENPDEFPVLRSYSPYHNALEPRCYPAILVQADANDDRVVAWTAAAYL
jgi:prolyl oligopeptidase